jgi:hypothetical protein
MTSDGASLSLFRILRHSSLPHPMIPALVLSYLMRTCIIALGKSYSTVELDRIISDIFSLAKGGSASKDILPEGEVCKLCDMAKEILQVEKIAWPYFFVLFIYV